MKYHVGDWVRVKDGYVEEANDPHIANCRKRYVGMKFVVVDVDPSESIYLCDTPIGREWFEEETLTSYAESFAQAFNSNYKGTVAPLWNTTEAIHDFIALMDKYGVTDYSVEKVNGVLTCKFSKETAL